ncbi:MAG: 50S ribosomal protein L11 methyltransferase [Candidatus Egerieousia sp.]|nr:50S ribosomal protein L11 methyltransferase [Candidatus Egerieousia sp.]
MDYIEVTFSIEPFSIENAEIVEAIVVDCGFESFVTEDEALKGYIPIDDYSAEIPRRLKILLGDFCDRAQSPRYSSGATENAAEAASGFTVSFQTNYIKEQNWNLPWEEQFSPIVVDGLCTVKADFHKDLKRTKYNITIKPNMAFGTGHHQTTTLMMRTLLKLAGVESSGTAESKGSVGSQGCNALKGKQVLDMGTGTGILAILAAKLGALRPVHAIDVDVTAVNSAKENLWKNRLHKAVIVLYGDASLIQAGKYDIILANINRNILMEDLSTYQRGLRPGGLVVMSGFFGEDIPMLVERGAELGLTKVYSELLENWGLLILGK